MSHIWLNILTWWGASFGGGPGPLCSPLNPVLGGNSGFYQVVAKHIFPGLGQQWWNFILPTRN